MQNDGHQDNSASTMDELKARIARLESDLDAAKARAIESEGIAELLRAEIHENAKSLGVLQALLEVIPAWVFIKDREHRYHRVSHDYANSLHISPDQFKGRNDLDLGFPESLVKGDPDRGIRGFWADDRQVMDSGERLVIPKDIVMQDGVERVYHTIKMPLRDAEGNVWAVLGYAQDVTRISQAEVALQESLQQQDGMIRAQQALILELSTPLIPVHHGVVVMPIIGGIDSTRAKQIIETLLEGIGVHGARTAILDITGVKSVDTHVAQALLQAAQAARLLGTEVILTGISPGVAQTLVTLDVDLRGIDTQSTLQQGIARALKQKF